MSQKSSAPNLTTRWPEPPLGKRFRRLKAFDDGQFEDYNTSHPHRGLRRQRPRGWWKFRFRSRRDLPRPPLRVRLYQNRIEHRLTKPHHPWTNGQVERINRTLKEAAVQRYHYGSHDELRGHLALFLDGYNYARRLKTLKGLTPYEPICRSWAAEPHRLSANPHHEMPGPNI